MTKMAIVLVKLAILAIFCRFCRISSSIGIDNTWVKTLAILATLIKSTILVIFCQFRQISFPIGIEPTWVNIGSFGDFGEIDKIANFGYLLKV